MGGNAVSFAEDIHPILLAKCSAANGCHSTANPFLPGHAQPDVADAYDATQSLSTLGGPVYARILIRGSGSRAGVDPGLGGSGRPALKGKGASCTQRR
jgi:hypothetical protein